MKNKIFKIFVAVFLLLPCVSWGNSSSNSLGQNKASTDKSVNPVQNAAVSGSGKAKKYKGVVKDAQGTLPGVTIVIAGTTEGCTTGANGDFECELSSPDVEISYVGYEKKTVTLVENDNNEITLTESKVNLNEVNVVENVQDGEGCNRQNEHIKSGNMKKIDDVWVCVPSECSGEEYEIKDNKCVEKTDDPKTESSGDDTQPKKEDDKKTVESDTRTPEQKAAAIKEKQDAYNSAKETEQSLANRTLTAATTAATGIGAMQALQGLAEQKADKAADTDMDAYIATMRCSYGDGKSVKAGSTQIELPGGNDQTLMNYRGEYLSLAQSLQERKAALNIKPGIESEVILDKANMGLYDQENTGITSGSYSSLYRAKMMDSEEDQTKLAEATEKSGKRVKAGLIAAGAGVAVGVVGNSAINGKLNELIKEVKGNISNKRENNRVISALTAGLESAGVTNLKDLDFSGLDLSALGDKVDQIDFSKLADGVQGKSATDILNTSNKASFISSFTNILGDENASLFTE